MENDKTVFKPSLRRPAADLPSPGGVIGIDATWRLENGDCENHRFFKAFIIGRDPACAIQQHDSLVSRYHAEVFLEDGAWYIRDLDSTNGTFLDEQPIGREEISQKVRIGLGKEGATLWLQPYIEPAVAPKPELRLEPEQPMPDTVTQFVRQYFDDNGGTDNPGRTKVIRDAFDRVSRKRTLKYRSGLAVVILLLAVATGFGIYEYLKLQKLRSMATDIFYTMKTLEVQLARQELDAVQNGSLQDQKDVDAKRQELAVLGREYNQYLEQTELFGGTLGEEDKLIYSVARLFGECELNMPPSFVREVKRYIAKWRSTPSLERSIARAEAHGFLPVVQRAMTKQDLPLQFFYLGLRESGFRVKAVGPQTRYGFAKGPWQFIPSTAVRYGMKTGPLVDQASFDPGDDRFDIYKSTYAAARYLKDIYATEAQASGLLVMASYNWGEGNINRLLQKMPDNPRDRNFWELINRFTIPDETYHYVLYIFSAAVIGENPGFFGFDFGDPLAEAKMKVRQ